MIVGFLRERCPALAVPESKHKYHEVCVDQSLRGGFVEKSFNGLKSRTSASSTAWFSVPLSVPLVLSGILCG